MKRCPAPIGVFSDQNGHEHLASCKQWSCSFCAAVKKRRILDRASLGFKGFRTYTATLTELKAKSNYETARSIMKHWNRLRNSLKKRGYPVERFFWTKEFKPLKGSTDTTLYPHLHVLLTANIPKKLLEHLWYMATDGTAYQVYYDETIDVKKAGAYLAKYMTKSSMVDGFNKGERRYGFSHGHFPLILNNVTGIDFDGVPFSFEVPKTNQYTFRLQYGVIRGERHYEALERVSENIGGEIVIKPFPWKLGYLPHIEDNCFHNCLECGLTRLCGKFAKPLYSRRYHNQDYDT